MIASTGKEYEQAWLLEIGTQQSPQPHRILIFELTSDRNQSSPHGSSDFFSAKIVK